MICPSRISLQLGFNRRISTSSIAWLVRRPPPPPPSSHPGVGIALIRLLHVQLIHLACSQHRKCVLHGSRVAHERAFCFEQAVFTIYLVMLLPWKSQYMSSSVGCILHPLLHSNAYILYTGLHPLSPLSCLQGADEHDHAGTQQRTRLSLSQGMSCSSPAAGPTIQRALTTAYQSLAVLEQQNITRVCDQDFCGSPCLAAIAWQSTTPVGRRTRGAGLQCSEGKNGPQQACFRYAALSAHLRVSYHAYGLC